MRTVRRDKTRRQKSDAEGRREGAQIRVQEFMFGDKRIVEYEMSEHTGNNWSHRNSNKRFKERCGSHTRKSLTFSLQKTAILGTSHITRKVLQSRTLSLSDGDRHWFKRRSSRE